MSYKNVFLCDAVQDLPVNVYEGAIAVRSDFSAVYYVNDGVWVRQDLLQPSGPSMEKILEAAYPVGTVYESVESTDPANLFGGKWERLKSEEIQSVKFYRWKRIA